MRNIPAFVFATALALILAAGTTAGDDGEDRAKTHAEMLANIGRDISHHLRSSKGNGNHAQNAAANLGRMARKDEVIMAGGKPHGAKETMGHHADEIRRVAKQIGEQHRERQSAGGIGQQPLHRLREAHAVEHSRANRKEATQKSSRAMGQTPSMRDASREIADKMRSIRVESPGMKGAGAVKAMHEAHFVTRGTEDKSPKKLKHSKIGIRAQNLAGSVQKEHPSAPARGGSSTDAGEGEE